MSLHVLVLSSEHGTRARDLLKVARSEDRNVRLATTMAEFESGLTSPESCVILHDLDGFQAPAADVLSKATPLGIPLLVIANNFDSEQWISLFKQGARDVLRLPLSAADLHRAIESARANVRSDMLESKSPWYIRTLQWVRNILG